jgi:hypothetical protein
MLHYKRKPKKSKRGKKALAMRTMILGELIFLLSSTGVGAVSKESFRKR